MKIFICLVLLMVAGACSDSGYHNGHAGAQSSQSPIINEPAGAELPSTSFRDSIVYGVDYKPARNFESSVLNEPDEHGNNDEQGRGYRVNGSGYGFKR
jgi:hypothetical protein